MSKLELVRISEIKSVRINIDHIQKVVSWLSEEGMSCNYYTIGIDNEYEPYATLEQLIDSKGEKPKSIVINGEGDGKNINVLVHVQYCIIEASNVDPSTTARITKLMKSTVPKILRVLPFIWFARITTVMFFSGIIGYFALDVNYWFLINYTVYPAVAFFFVGLYNNNVVGILLIRKHEKTSFWKRKKDDFFLAIITTLIIAPFAAPIWEKVIKPMIDYFFS
jgi:hypothetical protein